MTSIPPAPVTASPIRVAILTVSDRCSRGETVDTSGPALALICTEQLGAHIIATACCADEQDQIADQLTRWAKPEAKAIQPPEAPLCPDLILTAGGTGLAPRDVTPEATLGVLERRHPGLLELARHRCAAITPRTYLSRGEAGTLGDTLILNLPGSLKGATQTFEALLDILPHAIETLRGEVQDDGRPGAMPGTGKVIDHDR